MIDVAKIGELANLEFSEEELSKFQGELEAMEGYIQKLAEVDVDGVEPTVFGWNAANVLRDDIPSPLADRETFLANAPERINHEVKVPRIVE